ncbi:MAG: hypothetical protein IPP52_05185 [Ignavibacteria bacterium]|nr:hypothetical protein [Ignavibacteria bacterium]
MFWFKLLRSIIPEIINSDFIVRAFSIAVGFNQRPTAAIKLNVLVKLAQLDLKSSRFCWLKPRQLNKAKKSMLAVGTTATRQLKIKCSVQTSAQCKT